MKIAKSCKQSKFFKERSLFAENKMKIKKRKLKKKNLNLPKFQLKKRRLEGGEKNVKIKRGKKKE